MLLDVLSLEDEDEDEDVEDDVEDGEEDFDDVACSLALVKVEFVLEFVVELVPDMVMFAMLLEFMLGPAIVELPETPAAPVELLASDPGRDATPLFEPEEAVGECEEAVAEPVEVFEAEVAARARTASVGQVEHPPNNWSMPE